MKIVPVVCASLLLSFAAGYFLGDQNRARAQATEPEEHLVKWNPELRGDVNADDRLDIADAVFLINYCFFGGPRPGALPTSGLPSGVLPATLQKFCWSGTRGEVQDPCPAPGEPDYGQDANFKSGTPRSFELVKEDEEDPSTWYTIDHATQLMWQYTDDDQRRNWTNSLRTAEELTLGGFTDWRMPNVMELFSIVDISTQQPSIDRDFFSLVATSYWTSSSCIFDPSRAYTIRFNNGFVNCVDKGGQGQGSTTLFTLFCRTLD